LGDAGDATKLTFPVRLTLRLSQDEVLGRGSPICTPADDRFVARLRRDAPSRGIRILYTHLRKSYFSEGRIEDLA
jgi:hypothetical protein